MNKQIKLLGHLLFSTLLVLGITPRAEAVLWKGVDGSYTFWTTDSDGNTTGSNWYTPGPDNTMTLVPPPYENSELGLLAGFATFNLGTTQSVQVSIDRDIRSRALEVASGAVTLNLGGHELFMIGSEHSGGLAYGMSIGSSRVPGVVSEENPAHLIVQGGGSVYTETPGSNTSGVILGGGSNQYGKLTVRGVDTYWKTSNLIAGSGGGNGLLVVEAGAHFEAGGIFLYDNGKMTIQGAGSKVTTGTLYLSYRDGDHFSRLEVLDGGVLEAQHGGASFNLAKEADNVAEVLVSGVGSRIIGSVASGYTSVVNYGSAGKATIHIEDGGEIDFSNLTTVNMGVDVGGSGSLNITGAGSRYIQMKTSSRFNAINIGRSDQQGEGALRITDGGYAFVSVRAYNLINRSSDSLLVSGQDSLLEGQFLILHNDVGMRVDDGAKVMMNSEVQVNQQSTLEVSGAGTTLYAGPEERTSSTFLTTGFSTGPEYNAPRSGIEGTLAVLGGAHVYENVYDSSNSHNVMLYTPIGKLGDLSQSGRVIIDGVDSTLTRTQTANYRRTNFDGVGLWVGGADMKGELHISNGGLLELKLQKENSSYQVVSVEGGSLYIGDPTATETGSIEGAVASGLVVLNNGTIKARNITLYHNGVIRGVGEIILEAGGSFIQEGGMISPGFSPGILTIEGDFHQTAGGTLLMEVGGLNSGEFDQLVITGNGVIEGSLELSFIDGFAPTEGDQFSILLMGGGSNDFNPENILITGLEEGWEYEILTAGTGGEGGFMEFQVHSLNDGISVVPEPLTYGLLIGGILLMFRRFSAIGCAGRLRRPAG